MIFTSLFGDPFNSKTAIPKNELQFVVWAGIPLAGMILELLGWRFTRWFNVGYLSLFGLLNLAELRGIGPIHIMESHC